MHDARELPCPRRRWSAEAGFSLVELLVAIVVIGVLAAIAVPSFLDQTAKADDAEAKSLAISAAKSLESCATSDNGSYEQCTLPSLYVIDPTLQNGAGRISISAGPDDYDVVVTAKRGAGTVTYQVSRAHDGATSRTCATGSAPRGGCSAQSGGLW